MWLGGGECDLFWVGVSECDLFGWVWVGVGECTVYNCLSYDSQSSSNLKCPLEFEIVGALTCLMKLDSW